MKKIITLLIAFQISLFTFGQTDSINNVKFKHFIDSLSGAFEGFNNSENNIPYDSLSEIWVEGIFDGVLEDYGYKIKDYYISSEYIPIALADSLRGKRVIIKGKLKIRKGNFYSTNKNTKYIIEPKFHHYIYKEPEGFISR